VGGGGARSALWREIQAAVYGHPVETVAAEEGAAYGAAILAGVGAGFWASVDAACDRIVRTAGTTNADPSAARVMRGRYAEYRRIYPALCDIFRGASAPSPAAL
jgi:xylulokinase